LATRKLRLKNGLPVLLVEDHKASVVSVQMWVKTGSADERKGEEGISHFIEHLVFKGTEKFSVGQIAATVEASGGELNAYTSFDQTVFYVTISSQFTDVGLSVISQMMGFPKFDQAEIDNEREVVIEEIKRGNDSPGRQASRLLFSTVHKRHPYGRPVIGFDRVIKRVSRKTLVDYFQSRYIPKNMLLVIAGDIKHAEIKKKLEKEFGTIPNRRLRKVPRVSEPKQSQPRIKVKAASFEEAYLHMAWRVPGAKSKDIAALDVLAMILGQGETSRLVRALRLEKPIANSIGMSTFTPLDHGLISVSGTFNPEKRQELLVTIQDELSKFLIDGPSEEEMRRAIINLESEEFYGLETVDGLARKAGSFETLMGDFDYFKKFLKQVQSLTKQDVLRIARKYLSPKSLTIVMMVPRDEKESVRDLRNWLKGFSARHKAAGKSAIKKSAKVIHTKTAWAKSIREQAQPPKLLKQRLPSGATLIARPSFDTPVLTVKAGFLGGLRIEKEEKAGVTELLSRVWTSGTENLDERQIQMKIEGMAGGLSAFGGRNSAGVSLQVLAPFEKDASLLYADVLFSPRIDSAVVEREKRMMREALRLREDNPGQLVSQMFLEKMFQGHPYARDLYGSLETINTLTAADVEKHLNEMLRSQNLTLALSGAFDTDYWQQHFVETAKGLKQGAAIKNKFDLAPLTKEEKFFRHIEREQTHIIVGWRGLTLTDERRYTLQLIQSVLAGQGGRLFLELRDKASMAYSVAPMRMEGVDGGYMGAYIGCSPEKGTRAIEMLTREFHRLIETPVPQEELSRAKRYLIGRHDIDLQRSSAIASSLLFNEIYGIDAEETFQFAEKLRDIEPRDLQKLAEDLFSDSPLVCAVGRTQPW